MLRIKRDEEPEELLRISEMDRGSVFHAIVERFMRALPVRPPKPSDGPILALIAEEELDQALADGLTGHPVLWAGDRAAICEDVERWFEHELADERAHDFDQADYEVRFGPDSYGGADGPLASDDPLHIELPGGGAIEVAGRADRIDYRAVPAAFRVIDYKTGKAWGKENALDGGMALQLPIYLLAAAEALGLAQGGASAFASARPPTRTPSASTPATRTSHYRAHRRPGA